MKLAILAVLLLTGCSSFRLGTVLYCPYGTTCALQSVTPQPAQPEPAEPPTKPASASV